MDAESAIGNVDKYLLKTLDTEGKTVETNISKGFTINSEATYGEVDTASRALANLIRNTYNDTILVTNISVTEILAG